MTKKDILRKLSERMVDKVPAGWKTSSEWATAWKISGAQARKIVTTSVEHGLAERKAFRIMAGGRLYPTPHYRFK